MVRVADHSQMVPLAGLVLAAACELVFCMANMREQQRTVLTSVDSLQRQNAVAADPLAAAESSHSPQCVCYITLQRCIL
ncbi:hypothetical protein EYF80_067716 [Liparis tanakae]|uniref:Uncharacterized protein n=1 Tax=Liparis tanakae TaxID=230148 RepID=A0A4Z2E105_9TELE|nr:hypothetical protein EYF80_067716 [Liparis tanakae]